MGVKGQVGWGRDHDGLESLGEGSWRLASESGPCRQRLGQVSWAQPSLSYPPSIFHYFWRPLDFSPSPGPVPRVLLPWARLLPHSPLCLSCCLTASSGSQAPRRELSSFRPGDQATQSSGFHQMQSWLHLRDCLETQGKGASPTEQS